MTILIWISALSFVAMISMVSLRVVAIRNGKVTELDQPSIHSVVQPKVDFTAFFFVVLCRDIFKYLSLHFLLFIHRTLSLLKLYTIKVEKRFSRIIDAVHGKGVEGKRGSVSIFLHDLQVHKEKALNQPKKKRQNSAL